MGGAWVLQRWIVTRGKTRASIRDVSGVARAGVQRLPQNDPEAFGLARLALVVRAGFALPQAAAARRVRFDLLPPMAPHIAALAPLAEAGAREAGVALALHERRLAADWLTPGSRPAACL
jgi:hypothetical protein